MLKSVVIRRLCKKLEIEFRDITNELELLNRFLDLGEAIDGVRYPTAYVKDQGHCFGMFRGDQLVGGYLMITGSPFRCLEGVKTLNPNCEALTRLNPESLIELGGIWIDPDCADLRVSTLLWWHLVDQVSKSGKREIIYGYNLGRKGLGRMYARLNPEILFRGNPSAYSTSTHSEVSLETTSVARLKAGFYSMNIDRLFRRKTERGMVSGSKHVRSIPLAAASGIDIID